MADGDQWGSSALAEAIIDEGRAAFGSDARNSAAIRGASRAANRIYAMAARNPRQFDPTTNVPARELGIQLMAKDAARGGSSGGGRERSSSGAPIVGSGPSPAMLVGGAVGLAVLAYVGYRVFVR